MTEDHPDSDLHNACVHAGVNALKSLHEYECSAIIFYERVSVCMCFFTYILCFWNEGLSACVQPAECFAICMFPAQYRHDNIKEQSLLACPQGVCVCSNNGAWWTGAVFDAMKADRRETGPIRHVGAAN